MTNKKQQKKDDILIGKYYFISTDINEELEELSIMLGSKWNKTAIIRNILYSRDDYKQLVDNFLTDPQKVNSSFDKDMRQKLKLEALTTDTKLYKLMDDICKNAMLQIKKRIRWRS
jgi:hypothetical protein